MVAVQWREEFATMGRKGRCSGFSIRRVPSCECALALRFAMISFIASRVRCPHSQCTGQTGAPPAGSTELCAPSVAEMSEMLERCVIGILNALLCPT